MSVFPRYCRTSIYPNYNGSPYHLIELSDLTDEKYQETLERVKKDLNRRNIRGVLFDNFAAYNNYKGHIKYNDGQNPRNPFPSHEKRWIIVGTTGEAADGRPPRATFRFIDADYDHIGTPIGSSDFRRDAHAFESGIRHLSGVRLVPIESLSQTRLYNDPLNMQRISMMRDADGNAVHHRSLPMFAPEIDYRTGLSP